MEDGGLQEGDRPSLWKLDRLLAGDLPEPEASEVRAAAARHPDAIQYLETRAGLRSDLAWPRLRALTGKAPSIRRSENLGERLSAFLRSGSRRGGLAVAFAGVLGLSVWTWRAHEPIAAASGGVSSRFQAKGADEPSIRLLMKGVAYDSGDLVQARSGDTLGFSYRSAFPVKTQIWYREEGGEPQIMAGGSALLEWQAAMAWRPASQKIVLEGEWKRQTVWILWSKSPFTLAKARKLLRSGARDADVHTEAFRMAKPEGAP